MYFENKVKAIKIAKNIYQYLWPAQNQIIKVFRFVMSLTFNPYIMPDTFYTYFRVVALSI